MTVPIVVKLFALCVLVGSVSSAACNRPRLLHAALGALNGAVAWVIVMVILTGAGVEL